MRIHLDCAETRVLTDAIAEALYGPRHGSVDRSAEDTGLDEETWRKLIGAAHFNGATIDTALAYTGLDRASVLPPRYH